VSEAAAERLAVSLFIEPEPRDVAAARELGAGAVELHTGAFCMALRSRDRGAAARELERLRSAVSAGVERGVRVHAGHGIDVACARELSVLDGIVEYNIGHAIVCDALVVGLREAVRRMKLALSGGRP
jgi:pyridoxine 5-phosphate synthase